MTRRPHLAAGRALRGTPGRPPGRAALSALLAACALAAAGCGEAAVPHGVASSTTAGAPAGAASTATHPAPAAAASTATHPAPAGAASTPTHPAPAAGHSHAAPRRSAVVARIDVSSDAIIAEGKVHIAQGAPSDAEVKHEIEVERKAGVQLPSGESAASFENAPANSGGPAAGAETPEASWNPRLKPIAAWIVPVLEWAAGHGWTGTVTSGYRTFYEQAQLNAAGAFSAPAGLSNHETTVYPGGAVDVTNPPQLIGVLRGYPGPLKLVGGVLGPADPEHFSATGD